MNKEYGFVDSQMENLVMESCDRIERIKKNLDQLSIAVENSNAYYNSLNADLFNKKYDNTKINYKSLVDRMNSLLGILMYVKRKNDETTNEMLSYIKIEQVELENRGNK